jgi:hypothetical protein
MPEGAQTRSDLAEAGRKKLEAFRNRKSKKKKKKKEITTTVTPLVSGEKVLEQVKVANPLPEPEPEPEKVPQGSSELFHAATPALNHLEQNKYQSECSRPVKAEYPSASIQGGEGSGSGSGQSLGSFGGSRAKEDGFAAGIIRDKAEPSAAAPTESTSFSLQIDTAEKSKSSSSSLAASYSMLSDLYMSSPPASPKKRESQPITSVPVLTTNSNGLDSRKGKDLLYQLKTSNAEQATNGSSLRVPTTEEDKGGRQPSSSHLFAADGVSVSVSASSEQPPQVDEHKLVEQLRQEKELAKKSKESEERAKINSSSGGKLSEKDIEGFQGHLDLLTREKYELQRGLESQQKMIDSLTKENMALTESFNAKAASSSVFTTEIEDLKEQVDTLAGAAERALEERDAALNGSAASADRAKALASEVIQLEESLLQARSNELKAEKQSSIALEKFEGLQSKLQTSIRQRDALVSRVEHMKSGTLNGGDDFHTKESNKNDDLRSGNGSSTNSYPVTTSESNALTAKPVGLVTPTIAHSKTEMSALVDQLQRTTSFQTASMVQSIFSLLDDMSS